MPAMRSTRSTLGREFQLAQAFLSIMKFRMGERLAFSVAAPPELLDCEFPPTVVGTLLENAIKHGLEPSRGGGRIDLKAWHDGSHLVVEVADTGRGFSDSSGSGVGLANARERLLMLYGPQAELDLAVNPSGGVVARARIPLRLAGAPVSAFARTTAQAAKDSAQSSAAPTGAASTVAPPVAVTPEPRDAQRPAA